MMSSRRDAQISAGGLIGLAFALVVFPLRWLIAGFLAAGFHELCHYIAVLVCGGKIHSLRVTPGNAVMEAVGICRGKELIAILAGPIGGALPLLLARWMPCTAICALFYSVYNLLPIYPLDGGRALNCVLAMLAPQKATPTLVWSQRICFALIIGLGIYAAVWMQLGVGPLILAVAVVLRKNTLQTSRFRSTI